MTSKYIADILSLIFDIIHSEVAVECAIRPNSQQFLSSNENFEYGIFYSNALEMLFLHKAVKIYHVLTASSSCHLCKTTSQPMKKMLGTVKHLYLADVFYLTLLVVKTKIAIYEVAE